MTSSSSQLTAEKKKQNLPKLKIIKNRVKRKKSSTTDLGNISEGKYHSILEMFNKQKTKDYHHLQTQPGGGGGECQRKPVETRRTGTSGERERGETWTGGGIRGDKGTRTRRPRRLGERERVREERREASHLCYHYCCGFIMRRTIVENVQ